eukprot:TRINITY_DN3603_c0_g1_i1.p1 TRINITY_DN3603_c0_g1~~TRINITY_DN3603_c0_g1_i1.p1  ORF type:complete len:495 (-),score=86.12 TRINITY_DN3603_c0_g1_i1:61-1545(-)
MQTNILVASVLGMALPLPSLCLATSESVMGSFNLTSAINEVPSIMATSTALKELVEQMSVTNIVSIVVALFAVVLSRQIHQLLFSPLDVRKTIEGDVAQRGAPVKPSRSGDANTDNVVSEDAEFVVLPSTSRRRGNLPPAYPNGWFRIMFSQDVKKGEVKYVSCLGQDLVVFRSDIDGKVSILDAYCPHLGANLAAGGRVVNGCIECPFHGWQFNSTGKCTTIPYSDAPVPEFAKTRSWPCIERNGIICMWHDVEQREPMWLPPFYDEIDDGRFVFHGLSTHHVRAHVQEIPENGADTAHLNFLHVPFIFQRLGLGKLFRHLWDATWKTVQDKDHLSEITLSQKLTMFNDKFVVPGTVVDVKITQSGPGLVFLHFQTPFGIVCVIESVTPLAPLLQRCGHLVFAERKVPRAFAKFVLSSLLIQFERDIPIWNNKVFLPNPLVVRQDGAIPQFRRWYSKFYSKNHEKLLQQLQNPGAKGTTSLCNKTGEGDELSW